MTISTAGGAGIGLVWGWLIGSLEGHLSKPLRSAIAVALATVAISVQLLWFRSWQGLALFWVAALFAFLAHIGWRRSLRGRFGQ
jgi:hypothetical protein